jgi:hypothetical protein
MASGAQPPEGQTDRREKGMRIGGRRVVDPVGAQ